MSDKKDLDFNTPDSRGYIPDTRILGSSYVHQGNKHTYTITKFAWNGEDDTWMIAHERIGSSFQYLRSPANFFGLMSNGSRRYVRVG